MRQLNKLFRSLNRKVFIILGAVTGVVLLVIVGILILTDTLEDRSVNREEQKKMAYNADRLNRTVSTMNQCDLIYFEEIEELILTIDPYRERSVPWSTEEVSRFWIQPDEQDIDYFSEANHELIWNILKDAP